MTDLCALAAHRIPVVSSWDYLISHWLTIISKSSFISITSISSLMEAFNVDLYPVHAFPSIYVKRELCHFSLDWWQVKIHLLQGKCFNIPHHCDPHSSQTKWLIFNDLLSLTIDGVLVDLIRKRAFSSV